MPAYKALLGLSLISLSLQAQAHFFAETHDCKAPVKPRNFATEADRSEFEAKVDAYRNCLQAFVDTQNAAMDKHNQAGKQANDQWNRFVEQNLKPANGS